MKLSRVGHSVVILLPKSKFKLETGVWVMVSIGAIVFINKVRHFNHYNNLVSVPSPLIKFWGLETGKEYEITVELTK